MNFLDRNEFNIVYDNLMDQLIKEGKDRSEYQEDQFNFIDWIKLNDKSIMDYRDNKWIKINPIK